MEKSDGDGVNSYRSGVQVVLVENEGPPAMEI